MQWVKHTTYAESADGWFHLRRLSHSRDKCALFIWDERYRAHCRYVTQGTEAECKERADNATGD